MVSAVTAAVGEDGEVRDGANEEVRAARNKVAAIRGRLTGILKGHSGEVSEMVGSFSIPNERCKGSFCSCCNPHHCVAVVPQQLGVGGSYTGHPLITH